MKIQRLVWLQNAVCSKGIEAFNDTCVAVFYIYHSLHVLIYIDTKLVAFGRWQHL